MKRLLNTPISYFDNNSIGGILNRMSRDLFMMDEMLPYFYNNSYQMILMWIGFIVTISYSSPINLVTMILSLAICYFMRKKYFKILCVVKNQDSIMKAPTFQIINEIMNNLPTIRAYKAQSYFTDKLDS